MREESHVHVSWDGDGHTATAMEQRPGLWNRFSALIQGEVAADTLEAYRRAGQVVYDLIDTVEERRLDLKIRGVDPWETEPATQAELLSAWNAFSLQTLGDQFLDADYQANPSTSGFVPLVTGQQVFAFYRQVEGWLSRARQAQTNDGYRLDVAVPTSLPPWSEVEPCPRAHLDGMIGACHGIQRYAEAAFGIFKQAAPAHQQQAVQKVGQILVDATTKTTYAEQLLLGHVSQDLHEQVEQYAKGAIERYYLLGQYLAMPSLIEHPQKQPALHSPTPSTGYQKLPGPGEPGFDPWCLTDPVSRPTWKKDRAARRAIESLWRFDPEPQRTLAIQADIDRALARGDTAYATDRSGNRLGPYFCCPWSSIYTVRRHVTIGGMPLRPMQEFTFDVSAEDVMRGGAFRREVLPGSFQETDDVDYCDPGAPGHHDE